MLAYRLRHWVNDHLSELEWHWFSQNPNAIQMLEYDLTKVNWDGLSSNPNAIHLLKMCPDLINWKKLSANPEAAELLKICPDATDIEYDYSTYANSNIWYWSRYLLNGKSRHYQISLDEHLNSANHDLNQLDWDVISSIPEAIKLLESNQDKINWSELSLNTAAIKLLESNQDKINWTELSLNAAAIELLESNQDKIDWKDVWHDEEEASFGGMIWANPSIFTYDYERLKDSKKDLHESLMQELFHPKWIAKYLETHDDIDDYLP
jgi:hypothetical protein